MRATAITLLAALAHLASAAEPVATIRLPQPAKVESVQPSPTATLRLTPDVAYVIDSDVPVMVLSSPVGLVRVIEEAGPLRIKTRFADDPTKVQTRNFAGKYLYTLEPIGTGRVEVMIVPLSVKSESEVLRRMLDANNGALPPPVDPVNPVDPPVNPKAEKLLIVLVEETQNRTPGQGKVIAADCWRDFSKAGHAWMHLDKDDPLVKEKNWFPAVGGKPSTLPAVQIMNRVTGERLGAFELPDSAEKLTAKVKEFSK